MVGIEGCNYKLHPAATVISHLVGAIGFAAGALGYDGEIPVASGDEFGKLINKGLKLGGAYGRKESFYSSLRELLTNKNHLPTQKGQSI